MNSLGKLLEAGAEGALAITAPGRDGLTHGDLRALVGATGQALAGFGIGAGDAVAIVLPNGPEMATAFLAVAGVGTAAPLNPAYRAAEFDFYLNDLGARALIAAAGIDTPARDVARRLGIPIIDLVVDDKAPAGRFTLHLDGSVLKGSGKGGDIALILHTSGTTSRPKMVPLTRRNLCASAAHVSASLTLGPGDRCLNIMPLFHIHGLIAAVLASMAAGASVCCTSGFDGLKFFAWLKAVRPSWYTAVPTMHQTILARAARNPDIVAGAGLRFIRSSSASLAPQVMSALEATFGCPVIEAYGMTEAAHQMAANPLPPGTRKPGTVGRAAGPDVAVMDPGGALLGPGQVGEVVIRGPNVTAGYLNNPKANAQGFTEGWFRTGDQGVLDAEGYLTITGRLKEIINRGGEKISPREVDEVLMAHPAISQAVTFAMPHAKLGEEVAAAVVIEAGAAADPAQIRGFVGERLAAFKVPRRIVILDDIPKGATGKLQRIGLAKKLGLAP